MARPKNNYKSKQVSVPTALIPEVMRLIAEWKLAQEEAEFCRENELNHGNMVQVHLSKRKQHK